MSISINKNILMTEYLGSRRPSLTKSRYRNTISTTVSSKKFLLSFWAQLFSSHTRLPILRHLIPI